MADPMLDDLDRLPDGSLSQAEVRWLTAEIRRLRSAVTLALGRIDAGHPGSAHMGLLAALGTFDNGIGQEVADGDTA